MPEEHIPTDTERRTVESMAAYGIPQVDIAKVIGIDPKTLRLRYREELNLGAAKANSQVGKFLFTAASGKALTSNEGDTNGATYADCLRAAMFWAKTQMCWRETGGVPMPADTFTPQGETKPQYDLSKLSTDTLRELKRARFVEGEDPPEDQRIQ